MNRRNVSVLLGCVTVLVGGMAFAIAQSQARPQGQVLPITATATLAGQTIQLEVASSPQSQALGLMHRPSLPDNRGMLFPFEPAQQVRFWMKDVLIPLDMVFVYEGKVQAIAANVPPCQQTPCPTYGPNELVDQVIELRGGRAQEMGLRTGDPVKVQVLSQQP